MKIRKTSFPFFYCYWYKNQTSVRLNQIKTYARFSLLWLFFFLPWLLAIGFGKILPILYGACCCTCRCTHDFFLFRFVTYT